MIIEVVEKEGLKREMTIEVPAEVVDKTYQDIYAELRRNAKIDGFRPGKAPVTMIRSRYKEEATAELIDQLVKEYYNKAVAERKLDPVGPPLLQAVDVDEGKPFKFTVGIEILPIIEAVATDGFWVYRPSLSVTDEDVNRVVEELRRRHADIRTVDRPAAGEDILVCDLEIAGGDLDPAESKPVANQEIDLGHPMTDTEFREQLVGIKRAETRPVTVDYPADYPQKKFAGKKVIYTIAVKEVKERILPAINDTFASMVESGITILELKLKIRKELEANQQVDLARGNKRLIIDQLVEKNPVMVPDSLLEKYLIDVIEDFKKEGKPFDEAVVRQRYHPMGIASLRWYFLYHRLGELEKIEVSPEDTENWIKRFADSYGVEVPQARQMITRAGKNEEIKDGILEDKILEWLMSKAAVKTELPQTRKEDDNADSHGG